MVTHTLKAIDLFCGCGGISCGLRMAGVEVIAGVDIETKYIATFSENFPFAKSLIADISKISPSDFMKSLHIKPGELDILVGGPPCQGFSKNVPRKNRYLDDPRNQLIKSFLDYCSEILPKIVIIENVAEMKRGFDNSYTQEIIDRLTSYGYSVTTEVLNSADYGVPQKRRRAFFVANRLGKKIRLPKPTHFQIEKKLISKEKLVQSDLFLDKNTHVTVWEAISDLPSVAHDTTNEDLYYVSSPQNNYQEIMRINSNTLVLNHNPRKLREVQFLRLASLNPGEGHKDLPENLQVASGYSGAYGRLTKEMIAPTITRWVFHPGSGRWGHPVDIRTLTIREVARIQSFPDSYKFLGSYNDQAGQLGNAVPPLLANSIIKSIISQLETELVVNNDINSSIAKSPSDKFISME